MSTTATSNLDPAELRNRVGRFQEVQDAIVSQVRRVIVGQEEVLSDLYGVSSIPVEMLFDAAGNSSNSVDFSFECY